jgi:hypothetical protein
MYLLNDYLYSRTLDVHDDNYTMLKIFLGTSIKGSASSRLMKGRIMAKSGSQRTKEWRDREKRKGSRQIKIYIPPSTARRLDKLKKHFGGTIADIFDRGLKSLEAEMKSGVRKRLNEI